MALLSILHHPDPRLREKARPLTPEDFTPELQKLIDDMFETMYDAPGVGLAATQIGVALRLAVMDCSADKEKPEPWVMINPEVSELLEREEMEEGCLSVPDISDRVQRYRRLHLKALDRHGKPFELEAEDLYAQAIQHEIDHLDGKLYIDYLSAFKRDRITKKLQKAARRVA